MPQQLSVGCGSCRSLYATALGCEVLERLITVDKRTLKALFFSKNYSRLVEFSTIDI